MKGTRPLRKVQRTQSSVKQSPSASIALTIQNKTSVADIANKFG
jgi:hypothetical protein